MTDDQGDDMGVRPELIQLRDGDKWTGEFVERKDYERLVREAELRRHFEEKLEAHIKRFSEITDEGWKIVGLACKLAELDQMLHDVSRSRMALSEDNEKKRAKIRDLEALLERKQRHLIHEDEMYFRLEGEMEKVVDRLTGLIDKARKERDTARGRLSLSMFPGGVVT